MPERLRACQGSICKDSLQSTIIGIQLAFKTAVKTSSHVYVGIITFFELHYFKAISNASVAVLVPYVYFLYIN